MAIGSIDSLLQEVKEIFTKKDNKETEIDVNIEHIEKEIADIEGMIQDISYKALVEEDNKALKEYKDLSDKLGEKIREKDLLKARKQAIENITESRETKNKAMDLYKEIQKEIDSKSKERGKLTKEYIAIKNKLEPIAEEIRRLDREIETLPREIEPVINYLDAKAVGMEEVEFERAITRPLSLENLFEINKSKYQDKSFNGNEIYPVYQRY